jgi:hypothetical protein
LGKATTDASNDRGEQPQDSLNIRAERGPAAFQRRHVFNLTYVWEIPFPKNAAKPLRAFFANWQISGITFFWSGLPLTITQSGDDLRVGGNTRPNLTGDPEGPGTVNQWFNTSAFTPATTGFGTSGRGVVIGPGVNNWDITIAKNFRFGENTGIRFSADFINAFNHTILGNPNTILGNANFGRITATGRNAREIQLGLKFFF